ncbi:MAG: S8 family serine peptidase [Coleofasciculaceae cyanobacterium SM2_1_6]|nr:S8 family serine peptidase [Coleofasciculaceae cyanobacterium SM2_1_6]
MICQVSLFSRFLLLLSIPQAKQTSVASTRLFFRLGKDQKSPSFIPVDFTEIENPEIEVPEDTLESDAIADSGNVTEASDDPAASPQESPDLLASGDLTEVDGTEVEWDPLAKETSLDQESLDDLATDKDNFTTTQKVSASNEESADAVAIGADGADGADAVVTPEPVAEDSPAVEEIVDDGIEDGEEVAIAEEPTPTDLADETLDTSEDQDVVETGDEESDPVVDVADDIEKVDDPKSEESDQEDLELLGDSADTEPNLLSQVESGYYTVDATGRVEFTFIFDGGAYEGQLAAISMTGMENLDLNSKEFFQESLQRALSGSAAKLGYIVVDDLNAGAMFGGELETGFDYNYGEFAGSSIVEFRAGDKFFLMLIPNGSVAEVEEALEQGTTKDVRPLFSLVAANPTKAIQMGQIVDVTGDGNTYVFEDIRQDGASDKDFNDLIFQVKGATITTVTLDDLILEGEMSPEADWRNTEIGQQIVDYAASQVVLTPEPNPVEKYEFPKEDQPLVGFIDTHFTQGNPDIDYSRIIFGKDYIQNDSDPTVVAVAGEGTHGDHILGIVAATQDNGLGIDGINDDAPLWVSSAVESGKWAEALMEFVDAAKASNQPNAIINLSIDLTQVNPDGTVTTRYEFTPQERTAIEYARQNGVLIVAAAGNDGGVMSVLGQASQEFDNIITVGSSDGLTRAEYSSYGQGLGILAPGGTAIDPELSLTGEGMGLMSGTSVATAKVTGAASQVWAANPELSYRQVIEILKSTATDLSTPGWDAETGAGLLNMVAAVQAAKTTIPVVYKPEPLFAPDKWWGDGKLTPLEMPVANGSITPPSGPWRYAISDEQKSVGQEYGFSASYPKPLGRRHTSGYINTVHQQV